MPPRSRIETLPQEFRDWLQGELLACGFADYVGLTERAAEKLAELGAAPVSKSAVNRFGASFQKKIESLRERMELAKTITREFGDDEGTLADATIALAQDKLADILMNASDDLEVKEVGTVSGAIADLARASVTTKKHMAAVRAKAEKVAAEVSKQVRSAGLSDAAVDAINRKILGIGAEA